MFCPHRFCLGFQILSRHEGPRIAFELLFQKFSIGPRMIVYDNACVLHQYCMKREPAFFARTLFRVDRFHFCNHIGCCESYNLDAWPAATWVISPGEMEAVRAKAAAEGMEVPATMLPITLGKCLSEAAAKPFNSQGAEQYNSRLRFIATQVAYMTHDMYMLYLVMFMFRNNVSILAGEGGMREIDVLRALQTLPPPDRTPQPQPQPQPDPQQPPPQPQPQQPPPQPQPQLQPQESRKRKALLPPRVPVGAGRALPGRKRVAAHY